MEKPILFSTSMIQAILEGRKTQTRRVIKLRDGTLPDNYDVSADGVTIMDFSKTYPQWQERTCQYGQPGDTLWVRETWQAQNLSGQWWHEVPKNERDNHNWSIVDKVTPDDDLPTPPKWIPSIFMPRKFCRLTLTIKDVLVERVNDITESDAAAEGSPRTILNVDDFKCTYSYVEGFRILWESINAKRGYGWDVNPWVWVVEFEVAE